MLEHLLLAQAKTSGPAAPGSDLPPIPWLAVTVIAAGLGLFSLLLMLPRRYKRCPSNRILVIYGKTGGGNAARCIHGGAAFVMPLIQDYDYLNLEPIQI